MMVADNAHRLSLSTLHELDDATRPLVDPRELSPHVVHFGLGAFHRAHQAVYTEQAAAAAGEPWGIAAVEQFGAQAVDLLNDQDNLYSVTDRAPGALTTRVVGSIVDAMVLGRDPHRVRALLSKDQVGTVTLTVTEKGYYRRPNGELDREAAPIAADLAATAACAEPATILGQLAAGLRARRTAGGAPINVVSCDNMAGNGPALAGVVKGFVEASGWPDTGDLLAWMDGSVSFPATIVDRIVPATTAEDRDLASRALGLRDEMPVLGEPYRQWILQDEFVAARPRWELSGALFVPDVAPYQLMKLRLLNGSHSAMAYLGLATGCDTVADVLCTEWGESLVRAFGAEVAPSLPDAGLNVGAYIDDLVGRYRNPSMNHLLRQIGSDGSLKIPERWLGPLRELRQLGIASPVLELALAAWVGATRPDGEGGTVFATTDPASRALAECWSGLATPAERVRRLLSAIGAQDLADSPDLTSAVAARIDGVVAGRVEL